MGFENIAALHQQFIAGYVTWENIENYLDGYKQAKIKCEWPKHLYIKVATIVF